MSNVPSELKFLPSHEWVSVDGDVATVGVSDRQGVAERLVLLQPQVQFSAHRAQGGGPLPKLREPVGVGCAAVYPRC